MKLLIPIVLAAISLSAFAQPVKLDVTASCEVIKHTTGKEFSETLKSGKIKLAVPLSTREEKPHIEFKAEHLKISYRNLLDASVLDSTLTFSGFGILKVVDTKTNQEISTRGRTFLKLELNQGTTNINLSSLVIKTPKKGNTPETERVISCWIETI